MHWDCQRDADTKQLADILRSANLRQHVQERTHRHGLILDLVISRDGDILIKGVSVSSMMSDHFVININVNFYNFRCNRSPNSTEVFRIFLWDQGKSFNLRYVVPRRQNTSMCFSGQ